MAEEASGCRGPGSIAAPRAGPGRAENPEIPENPEIYTWPREDGESVGTRLKLGAGRSAAMGEETRAVGWDLFSFLAPWTDSSLS